MPQIIAKGSILNQWDKKQAVALQVTFYESLPPYPEVQKDASDFALFLYELVQDNVSKTFSLKLKRVVYTKFANVMEQITKLGLNDINFDFSETDYLVEEFTQQFEEVGVYEQ